jgi:hypothetical protein
VVFYDQAGNAHWLQRQRGERGHARSSSPGQDTVFNTAAARARLVHGHQPGRSNSPAAISEAFRGALWPQPLLLYWLCHFMLL